MKGTEEYLFFLEGNPIRIGVGKIVDVDGQTIYWAQSDFKPVFYIQAENLEVALENCVKEIKLAMKQKKKEVKLIKQDRAAALAKKYFLENYTNRTVIKEHLDELWHEEMVGGQNLSFFVKKESDKDHLNDPPITVAIVYVNRLTGECDMIENKAELKWYKDDH